MPFSGYALSNLVTIFTGAIAIEKQKQEAVSYFVKNFVKKSPR